MNSSKFWITLVPLFILMLLILAVFLYSRRKTVKAEDGQIKGIGGWLILPAIGLVFFLIQTMISLYGTLALFWNGSWEMLTKAGSDYYHHLWGPFIIFEVIGIFAFIVFSIFLLYFFITKSYKLPKLFIIFLITKLLFLIFEFLIYTKLPVAEGYYESARELSRAFIGSAIWIPYFMISKRVKNTFVKPVFNAGQAYQPEL